MVCVAAVQMCSSANLADNLSRAEQLVAQAVSAGAELVVLPENFAYYGSRELLQAGLQEQTANGQVRTFAAGLARKHKIWLVAGTVPVCDSASDTQLEESRAYACCLVYNDKGEEVSRYHKIHLFDVDVGDAHKHYRESDDYRPGSEPVVVDTPFGKLGLSVCYDLRFAELYRQLSDMGADIIMVPSAFTAATGEAHWQLLLRARAVENQCFMIGANMGDRTHPKRPTWGGSAIIHPWGNVLAELAGGEGVVCANLDLQEITHLKSSMPVAEHRRLNKRLQQR